MFVNVNVYDVFIIYFYFFFFSAAQEAQQTSRFGSAHGADRQYTFVSKFSIFKKFKKKLMRQLFWNAGADEIQGFFFTWS